MHSVSVSLGSQFTQPSALNTSYGYDAASRLNSVSDDTYSATYSYLANSPLVSQITFKQNTTTRLTTTKQYDLLNRLQGVSSAPSALSAVSFGYTYDNGNQRTRRTEADGSFWVYRYDALGQVVWGKRHWSDGPPMAGQALTCAFDEIGNRDLTGGRASAVSDYAVNRRNQYTQRTVAPYADIVGIANSTANVTVDGNVASRKGEATLALDGKPETYWHTGWTGVTPSFPHALVIDLGERVTFEGFGYLPRQEDKPGRIKDFKCYAREDRFRGLW